MLPPQADGGPSLLLLSCGLHPPLTLTVANHALNKVFTESWLKQVGVVELLAGVKLAVGAVGTVKVALVVSGSTKQ